MTARLSRIDELSRPDHTFLTPDDVCYYLGDYTARKGFSFSEMNNLINNLRKPVERRGRAEWRYKESAILTSARLLRDALNEEWLSSVTLVPVPPSQARGEAGYDDRVTRILQALAPGRPLDIRDLVVMTKSVEPSHLADTRVSIDELIASMRIDAALVHPRPANLVVFDDVLTTGRHFKAVQSVLRDRYPATPMVGLFVARRVPEPNSPSSPQNR